MHIYIYIYIYIERERDMHIHTHIHMFCFPLQSLYKQPPKQPPIYFRVGKI